MLLSRRRIAPEYARIRARKPSGAAQREVEARLKALGDELGARQGVSRRAFFRTAAGMAAAYVAMNKDQSRYPWRLDDEKLLYPAYEKMAKAGVLFAPALDQRFPTLRAYCDVRDVGKAAKDWPQLNFIIYHGAYRFAGGGDPADALAQFEQTGRVEWVTDLAESNGRSRGSAGSRSRRACRRSTAIFGENVARLYRYNRHAELAGPSRLAELRAEYERRGMGRSNRRYGYVVRG